MDSKQGREENYHFHIHRGSNPRTSSTEPEGTWRSIRRQTAGPGPSTKRNRGRGKGYSGVGGNGTIKLKKDKALDASYPQQTGAISQTMPQIQETGAKLGTGILFSLMMLWVVTELNLCWPKQARVQKNGGTYT